VRTWEQESFLNAISSDAARQKLWLTALIQTQSLMYRLTGLGIDRQAGLRGDTEVYSPGAVIIQQGDPADDVFSMVAGVAQVLVDEQPVARIATGELFGTMAGTDERAQECHRHRSRALLGTARSKRSIF
jgi:hypothetical protein